MAGKWTRDIARRGLYGSVGDPDPFDAVAIGPGDFPVKGDQGADFFGLLRATDANPDMALVDLMKAPVAVRIGGKHGQGFKVVGHPQQRELHLLGDGPGPGFQQGHGIACQGLAAAVNSGLADFHDLLAGIVAQSQQRQQGKQQKSRQKFFEDSEAHPGTCGFDPVGRALRGTTPGDSG